MSVTDPIADYLTRIRNAYSANHRWVDIPSSNLKKKMSLILKHEHYINDFMLIKDKKQGLLRIFLRYTKEGKPVIDGIKRISRPGRRVYVSSNKVPRVIGGLGIAIISTSQGILTDKVARKMKAGGEVICYVW